MTANQDKWKKHCSVLEEKLEENVTKKEKVGEGAGRGRESVCGCKKALKMGDVRMGKRWRKEGGRGQPSVRNS